MNIKDVARISGVGISTVSRVINNHPDVKDETRQRVLGVIKEINYIPNNSARILKRNNTKNIGVMLKGFYNPFFSEMLKTISNKIEQNGYTMILQHNDQETKCDMDTLAAFIKEKRLQGVVCLGGNFLDVREESFEELDIPIVLTSVNESLNKKQNKVSSIGIDNIKSTYEAIQYIISKGHKNIGLILGKAEDVGVGKMRLEGYKLALSENNIDFHEEYIVFGDYKYKKSYLKSIELLDNNKEITAIFAISDIMAIGAAKAVFKKNLKVKKDIAIMGFDGMDIGEFYEPSITTIKQPRDEMAKQSVDLLFDLINNKSENKQIVLETELIERESI
jgi:LacI family transcriptional regulator